MCETPCQWKKLKYLIENILLRKGTSSRDPIVNPYHVTKTKIHLTQYTRGMSNKSILETDVTDVNTVPGTDTLKHCYHCITKTPDPVSPPTARSIDVHTTQLSDTSPERTSHPDGDPTESPIHTHIVRSTDTPRKKHATLVETRSRTRPSSDRLTRPVIGVKDNHQSTSRSFRSVPPRILDPIWLVL